MASVLKIWCLAECFAIVFNFLALKVFYWEGFFLHLDCQKFDCTECCRRYWISILPSEAKAQSKFLNLGLKEFLEKNCMACIQLFPSSFFGKGLFLKRNALPKKVLANLSAFSNSEFFMALPSIVFKRFDNACIFLKENGLCGIYGMRPKQCSLFPFIQLNESVDFVEKYPFCRALPEAEFESKFGVESKKHFLNVQNHFNEVEEKGFEKVWGNLPLDGIVLFKDKPVSKLSVKQFLKLSKFPKA